MRAPRRSIPLPEIHDRHVSEARQAWGRLQTDDVTRPALAPTAVVTYRSRKGRVFELRAAVDPATRAEELRDLGSRLGASAVRVLALTWIAESWMVLDDGSGRAPTEREASARSEVLVVATLSPNGRSLVDALAITRTPGGEGRLADSSPRGVGVPVVVGAFYEGYRSSSRGRSSTGGRGGVP
ncbi:MAG: hypothetical protein R3181_00095 [Rubricoccaceae bacterium]|nr:hypothetical protein [Rubricoccaceae bacterium]